MSDRSLLCRVCVRLRGVLWLAATGVVVAAVGACASGSPSVDRKPPPSSPVAASAQPRGDSSVAVAPLRVRVLAFNDFHGNLRPPSGRVPGISGEVGGAAYFASHVKRLRAGHPNAILVAAGDLVGGSPLTSALFHDEPTVDAMNAIGLDVLAVGNHEFDEGIAELLRLKKGGCHPKDGCTFAATFAGARFDVLGANVVDARSDERMLPDYVVRTFEGIPIAFIGMTLEDTPSVVVPSGVEGLRFRDEVKTVAALVPKLKANGIEAIVVLLHQGGLVKGGGLDDCNGFHGALASMVERFDPAVDVIVSGHTHALYNCRIGGRPVTSALSFGRVITAIDLTIDRTQRDVIATEARNVAVTHDVPPDPEVAAIVERATSLAAPRENRVIGRIAATIRADSTAAGESPLGSVAADAHLEATRKQGARAAFTNSGGLRADLVFAKSGAEAEDGLVTYGEAAIAQPFGNVLMTLTMRGSELRAFVQDELRSGSVLQVSSNVAMRWSAVSSSKTLVALTIDGRPIADDATIKVTVNNFLADTSGVLKRIRDRVQGPTDIEALEAYFRTHKLVAPPVKSRISREP